jgi:hypothetical protein
MDFWNVFWLLLIFIPLVMMWGFGVTDIFRRDDLSGGGKAVWLLVVLVLPLIGSLIYLALRPATHQAMTGNVISSPLIPDPTTTQLQVLADLHDRGKLTDEEFAGQKGRVITTPPPVVGS